MKEEDIILTSLFDCSKTDLILKKPKIGEFESKRIDAIKERRSAGEPLQYILGNTEFMGLKILVDKSVLIPRPETEIMADVIIREIKSKKSAHVKILDIGTGSGNIAIALAKNVPYAKITAIDISLGAIELAKKNAKVHAVESRINFVVSSLESFLENMSYYNLRYDIIVSNPPYIPSAQIEKLSTEVKCEPRVALDGGPDGLSIIRKIITCSSSLLNHDGTLYIEIGDGQDKAVYEFADENCEYKHVKLYRDYKGVNRIVKLEGIEK